MYIEVDSDEKNERCFLRVEYVTYRGLYMGECYHLKSGKKHLRKVNDGEIISRKRYEFEELEALTNE